MLIENMEDEPKVLADDVNFLNVDISADRKSIVWRYSPVGEEVKLKRYNVDTGEVTMIPAAPEAEGDASTQTAAPMGG